MPGRNYDGRAGSDPQLTCLTDLFRAVFVRGETVVCAEDSWSVRGSHQGRTAVKNAPTPGDSRRAQSRTTDRKPGLRSREVLCGQQ
jgi:hypothetical protein